MIEVEVYSWLFIYKEWGKLRDELFQELFKRTFDHKLSETLTQKTLIDLGLPERKI